MVYYIRKSIFNEFIDFVEPLKPEDFNLGTTWEDYLEDKWTVLSEEQAKFHEEHPEASIPEVWNMTLKEDDIEYVKISKMNESDAYGNSAAINTFTINGIQTWFSSEERLNHKQSVDSAKLLDVDTVSFFVNDTLLEVPTEELDKMLARIKLYIDQCTIVTKQHRLSIEKLRTIKKIKNYDFTTGYPEKLTFDI